MAGIGFHLRQAREKKGYSIEEMNRITNIHTEYLYALENDQFDQLPSPFYARAFLRTYAKSLGLEAQPLLDLFESQNQTPVSPAMNQRITRNTSMSASENNLQESFSEPTYPSQPRSLLQTSPRQQKLHLPAAPPSNVTMKEELPSSPAVSHTNSFPNLPKPISSQSLSPRRVAIEAKQASEESKNDKKRKKSRLAVVIAIGALLLVGGVGTYFAVGSNTPTSMDRPAGNTGTAVGDINANPQNTPRLIEGDVSNDEYEGQQYFITNVDHIEVRIKVRNVGEVVLQYGDSAKPVSQRLTIGQDFKIPDIKGDKIWFRISVPSNVDIYVNDQQISTQAQDTEKSYRVQIQK